MIIELKSILDAPGHFHLVLEPNWWQGDEGDDQILGLDRPLRADVSISRSGSRFILNGNISGGIQVRCGRCLEPYHWELDSAFRVLLTATPADPAQNEVELLEDDMAVDYITGDELDLAHILRGQIYLSIPMKPLCREDCLGLCPGCGVNLNHEKCGCLKEKGHPAFSKLKQN